MGDVNVKLDILRDSLKQLSEIKSISSNEYLKDELNHIHERLNDNTFRIAVVGEFSSGKSTFINALIGKDVLAHSTVETTAAITYIQNVAEDDKRCNTGLVRLRNGEELKMDNISDVIDYTKTQSDKNAAVTVSSVTIYVNFVNVDYPVLIIDTPGLNGIAEHHREITIEEIKKVHTCIYLLSERGIKKTDSETIKMLNDYQSSFLFLQNFIDELHESEGDTLERKLKENREILDRLKSDNYNFEYEIIGISALKALVSKDKSINRLYRDDPRILTDEVRKSLYTESGFSELESYIENLISSGEYKNVIVQSAQKRLITIINCLLEQFEEIEIANKRAYAQDEDKNIINSIDYAIKAMSERKERKQKSIKNFVQSKSIEYNKLIRTKLDVNIQELYEKVCSDIDERIKTYDSFINFYKNHGIGRERFYEKMISEKLNNIVKQLQKDSNSFLNSIYKLTIERVETYVQTKSRIEKIKFNINKMDVKFEMDENEIKKHTSAMEDYQMDLEKERLYLENAEKEKAELKSQSKKVKAEISDCESQLHQCDNEKSNSIRKLGSKPPIKEWTEYEPKQIPTKIFGIPIPRTKSFPVKKTDASEQNRWIEKYNEIVFQYKNKRDNLSEILECKKESLSDIKMNLEYCNNKIQRNKYYIKKYLANIEQQKEIYANTVRKQKEDYVKEQKLILKQFIESMLNDTEDDSSISLIHKYVDDTFEKNTSIIEEKGILIFEESFEKRKKELEEMVGEKSESLENRYKTNEEEKSNILEICKRIDSED